MAARTVLPAPSSTPATHDTAPVDGSALPKPKWSSPGQSRHDKGRRLRDLAQVRRRCRSVRYDYLAEDVAVWSSSSASAATQDHHRDNGNGSDAPFRVTASGSRQ